MFANSRTERLTRRSTCDSNSSTKMKGVMPLLEPGGIRVLKYPMNPWVVKPS